MKHPTDVPAEQIMRFFTPELYLQFNSPDDGVADDADEAWEKALQEYQQHLQTIRPRLPFQVREIAGLSLHDAEILGFEQELQSVFACTEPFWPAPIWAAMALLSLKQDTTIRSLIYILWDRIRDYPAPQNWPFSKARKHWLYDEVDVAAGQRGGFLHRVLFSDGSIAEIPFVSAITSCVLLPDTDEGSVARQIA